MKARKHVQLGRLAVDSELYDFVNAQVLSQTDLAPENFWQDFESLTSDLAPINESLLLTRGALQQKIDQYHLENPKLNFEHYKQFLTDIGYLQPTPEDFSITSENVDDEVATIAGPQLVVPVMNARYALNAANARWGSLYDALYGTDVIPETGGAEKGGVYNPVRGEKVVAYGRELLNSYLPLKNGNYQKVTGFSIDQEQLTIHLTSGPTTLENPEQFLGYQGKASQPTDLLFKHNNLHIIINIDADHPIGMRDSAHIKDITLEAAITTIMDCEDSVAAVDAEDKIQVYKNWLGLMQGNLNQTVVKDRKQFTRELSPDKHFTAKTGENLTLPGRSMLFVRNVGHLMTNPAILLDGKEMPEGIMDAIITSAIGKIDIEKPEDAEKHNSKKGSIYIVKPKMHGPDEVAFTNTLFDKVEDMLNMPRHTIKMGIMDEERRTSVNLKACVKQAKDRVVFINTGFLDRTGDEIHTSIEAGVFHPKAELKNLPWINAYEASNVAVGLSTGFKGKAQIGKGMWPIPDQMANMMQSKTTHPKAGATTAWVPSPTAATLHAIHYHQISVPSVQEQLQDKISSDIDTILQIPVMANPSELTQEQITKELENNAQGILGYVVRWVDQGVGCSKVPDINNVGLMEDRATCRISSQHIANWLHQGICSEQQVLAIMKKMAIVVDQQNADDASYQNMAPDYDESYAFKAAVELVIEGAKQPSGYTEPVLHKYRLLKKAAS
ncbi:MAG: malate synthase G [Gammaproteobacteria bacterium]|nr:malate synthase G [Gammaproteobacteria bacterium]